MGLGRFCDQMTLEQKIRSLFLKDREKDTQFALIPPKL